MPKYVMLYVYVNAFNIQTNNHHLRNPIER